jgi:hypothetical protein
MPFTIDQSSEQANAFIEAPKAKSIPASTLFSESIEML